MPSSFAPRTLAIRECGGLWIVCIQANTTSILAFRVGVEGIRGLVGDERAPVDLPKKSTCPEFEN